MMTNKKPDERLDDLQVKGYEIIQKPGRFCFGMDAVLLSSYAKVKRGERALDLGTGTGILPILLEAKNPGLHYTCLLYTSHLVELAVKANEKANPQIHTFTGRVASGDQFISSGEVKALSLIHI